MKKNRYIVEAVRKMIKVRDLKPSKDAKGGVHAPGSQKAHGQQGASADCLGGFN